MVTFGFCVKMFFSGLLIFIVVSIISENFYFDDDLISRVAYWSAIIVSWVLLYVL